MPSHAAVGVDNNFAPSEPGIAHRPANHEPSRGIDVIFRVRIEKIGWNDCLDYMLQNVRAKLVIADRLGMLRRNNDRIHAHRLLIRIVFNCNLGFSIRTEVGKLSVFAHVRKPLRQLVCQRNRHRHQFCRLIAGIAKHHPLVAGAAGVHAHRDVAGLLVDARDHGASIGIESVKRVVVADRRNHAPDHRLKVHISFGGDFACDDYEARRKQGFTSDAAGWILGQACVEDGIRNLVGDFVRMPLGYRFGRK